MTDFLKLYEAYRDKYGWALEIYNSSIMDWCVTLGHKTTSPNRDKEIFRVQHCDFSYVMAKAEVMLKDWLLENNDGY